MTLSSVRVVPTNQNQASGHVTRVRQDTIVTGKRLNVARFLAQIRLLLMKGIGIAIVTDKRGAIAKAPSFVRWFPAPCPLDHRRR